MIVCDVHSPVAASHNNITCVYGRARRFIEYCLFSPNMFSRYL